MTGTSKSKFVIVFAVVAGFIILWLLSDNEKKKKKIGDLQKEIEENDNLNAEIKSRLKELIQNHQDIEPIIAAELGHIAALFEIKQDATAVLKLAKIIENLLKEYYKGKVEIKEMARRHGRKNPVFADHLELAKKDKLIDDEEFHLMSLMKIIRNEEAHELDVKKEKSRVLATVIAGMGIILSLCRILKKKTLGDAHKK